MATTLEPPSKPRLFAELRAFPEYIRYGAEKRSLRQLPAGDGHPVMVFPGLAANDRLTAPLRRSIAALGYPVTGWELGRNLGLRRGVLDAMLARLRGWHDQHGRKVSLIGWSLGGLYARELAKMEPERVRQVITLGTPSVGDLRANNAWRLYEALNDHKVDAVPIDSALHECPPVPITSIYSPDEGIVPPGAAMIPEGGQRENIAVDGSHIGLPWNPDVIRLVLDRLALPEGGWRAYRG
ncbi:alpha/beta hydrolase [Sphingoaurantiacus capsulatus]|uniref:Alpha/beta hydrolase n=1 Tax=Sphingoaurantiacus capsulatus TaxID=1771310 RepID=A0ABV7X9M7_9SPHN